MNICWLSSIYSLNDCSKITYSESPIVLNTNPEGSPFIFTNYIFNENCRTLLIIEMVNTHWQHDSTCWYFRGVTWSNENCSVCRWHHPMDCGHKVNTNMGKKRKSDKCLYFPLPASHGDVKSPVQMVQTPWILPCFSITIDYPLLTMSQN